MTLRCIFGTARFVIAVAAACLLWTEPVSSMTVDDLLIILASDVPVVSSIGNLHYLQMRVFRTEFLTARSKHEKVRVLVAALAAHSETQAEVYSAVLTQLRFLFDARQARRDEAIASALLEASDHAFDEVRQLHDEGAASSIALETARAARQRAENRLLTAQVESATEMSSRIDASVVADLELSDHPYLTLGEASQSLCWEAEDVALWMRRLAVIDAAGEIVELGLTGSDSEFAIAVEAHRLAELRLDEQYSASAQQFERMVGLVAVRAASVQLAQRELSLARRALETAQSAAAVGERSPQSTIRERVEVLHKEQELETIWLGFAETILALQRSIIGFPGATDHAVLPAWILTELNQVWGEYQLGRSARSRVQDPRSRR